MNDYILLATLLCNLLYTGMISAVETKQHEERSRPFAGAVTTISGDRFPARISKIDKNETTFKSSYFDETITLPSGRLKSIGFHQPPTEKAVSQHKVRFQDGTQLSGTILSVTEYDCQFQSPSFGLVSFPLNQVAELADIESESKARKFTALNATDLAEWLMTDSSGNFILPENSQLLKFSDLIEGDGCFSIEFSINANTDFQILYGQDHEHLESIVGVTNGGIVLESSGELEFGEYQTINGKAHLKLSKLGDEFHLLNSIGQSLLKIPATPKNLCFGLKNIGSPLQVRQISIDKKGTSIIPIEWKLNQLLSFSTNGVEEVSDLKTAFLKLIEHKTDRIWAGPSLLSETSSDNDGYVCLWEDGDRITCQSLSLSDGSIMIESSRFPSRTIALIQLPSRIYLPAQTTATDTSAPPKQSFQLKIGGVPYDGSFSWGNSQRPVRWKFKDFNDPVSLNHDMKIEISKKDSTDSHSYPAELPDRLVLSDGSLFPCRVLRISEAAYEFHSAESSETSVDAARVRCCFLNVVQDKWRDSLTNESIQQALTLPRSSRNQAFTHIIISHTGDLLRGNVISMDARRLSLESKLEHLSLDRASIAGIISLPDIQPDASKAKSEENKKTPVPDSKDEATQIQLDCGDDCISSGRFVGIEQGTITVQSDSLGRMRVVADQIRAMSINTTITQSSPFQAYANWHIMSSADPHWASTPNQPAHAKELLNRKADDFEAASLREWAKSEIFRLSDHRGKIVVLSFWATDSRPSVVATDNYLQALNGISSDDVVFAAINQGETASKVTEFVQSQNWHRMHSLLDPAGEISANFQVKAVPHLIVIDQQGTIRSTVLGYSKSSSEELMTLVEILLHK